MVGVTAFQTEKYSLNSPDKFAANKQNKCIKFVYADSNLVFFLILTFSNSFGLWTSSCCILAKCSPTNLQQTNLMYDTKVQSHKHIKKAVP